MKRLKKEKFVSYFKIDRNILYIAVVDVLFYIVLAGVVYLFSFILLKNLASLESIYPTLEKFSQYFYQGGYPASIETAITELEAAKSLMFKVIVNSILIAAVFYIMAVVLVSLFKGLVWAKISNQKFNLLFFRKFLLLNYIWYSFFAVIFTLSFIFLKENIRNYFLIIGFLLFIYGTLIIYSEFKVKEKILRIIKEGVISCFKINKLFLILISFLIFILISYLIFLLIKGVALVLIILVLFSFYMALVRRYLTRFHLF